MGELTILGHLVSRPEGSSALTTDPTIHHGRPTRRALALLLLTLTAVAAFGEEPARRPRVALALGGGPAKSQIDRVIGQGRHASAMYDRRRRGDREGLGVEIRDKS